ncbi:hypothetical protein A3F03_00475 [Candidatus Roizmanbacteria bacterium RIFCSPHIGHO2_12_FULL_41_11]|uniref:SpoVT-AbrB domain-containing protein n=2 Tax=Candidatus Roizmaniibacteriota TaxID=1752723 RepID=A0A1F7J7U6_9BACT|nr:MAG: hypothetical protein A3F03_00475 [Candidatus Roizmanbacteria bacterium RIFCSPHIGHO2_12_FULL_41_11]OGK51684.1 MAG: hypothetical protein A2966_05100 [Candidatus Roizmanbacteria bacterium RIFCSPLOWO2_01_FULL_41_22]
MYQQTTITPNFQVHLPVAIRKKAGITSHGRALIRVEQEKIIIEKIPPGFLALGGAFSVKKPIAAEKIRDKIDLSP